MKIKRESIVKAQNRRRKKKKPLKRKIEYAGKDIMLELDIHGGEWKAVSSITQLSTGDHLIIGTGDSVEEAKENYKACLDNLMRSCSDSLAMGIELAPYLANIYKYFTE